jgi:hypothetical protein
MLLRPMAACKAGHLTKEHGIIQQWESAHAVDTKFHSGAQKKTDLSELRLLTRHTYSVSQCVLHARTWHNPPHDVVSCPQLLVSFPQPRTERRVENKLVGKKCVGVV